MPVPDTMAELPWHILELPSSQGGAPIEMAVRLIPEGEFTMGSRGEFSSAEPVHRVRIAKPFWLGETPVTQEQFAAWTTSPAYET